MVLSCVTMTLLWRSYGIIMGLLGVLMQSLWSYNGVIMTLLWSYNKHIMRLLLRYYETIMRYYGIFMALLCVIMTLL